MSQRPVLPIRPAVAPARPPGGPARAGPWRWRLLLEAPHRLGFFLAMAVLVASGAWWALVLWDRLSTALTLDFALSPTLVHATVMVYGFMPLFFAGFLFTAGPKWLAVPPLPAQRLLAPLLLQALGWLLWLAGAQLSQALAWLALAGALLGLAWTVALFWQLVRRSPAPDRLHARLIGLAGLLGVASLAGVGLGLALGAGALARAAVLSGLWGFVVLTYVTVAHRMIPFFTSAALPGQDLWRPFWVLWLLVAVVALQLLAVWLELLGPPARAWMLLRGLLELAAGAVLLWLAGAWGLVQSLKIRLLAMLHIGFVWLGLALLLDAASQCLGLVQGVPPFGLGALHALAMGALGSLMLAMVTRVTCGHGGRALVADRLVWTLFLLLQLAVLLRLAGAVPGAPPGLLLAAAGLWAGLVAVWGLRYAGWYGRARSDGKPG